MKPRTPNCHTPTEPKPTNAEQRDRRTRYQILADSELNRRLWKIKEAAEQLESLIEDFEEARIRDMSEVHLADLGDDVPASEEWTLDWHDTTDRDVMGFKWGLTQFKDLLRTLGKRPSELDEDEADAPAVVRA